MKMKLVFILAAGLSLLSAMPLQSQMVIKEQQQEHGVFKGLFLSVWSSLRNLQPHRKQAATSSVTYTAGIRGAESTETLIQPYWKNDLSQDEAFQQQLALFGQAQELMDQGRLQEAVAAFDTFIEQHGDSDLAPNALLSRGICEAALGDTAAAKKSIRRFIDANPRHQLLGEATQLVQQFD